MLTLFFSLLLVQQLDGPGDRPTAAQVEEGHRLLNGDWEIVSYIDDGENIGTGIIKAKMAKDGRIQVDSRTFRIVNPETNEVRVVPFRINPIKSPRQIEVTTRDDRMVSGIYKFDGDELLVCLETFPDTGYPGAFDAPMGSNRRLIRLKMITPTVKPAQLPKMDAAAVKMATTAAVTPDEHAAKATLTSSRRPTESELTRVRQLFSGNWDIVSIDDDGERLGQELIRQRFAEDGRIKFGTRAFAIVNPKTEERKVNSYRIDPTKTPSEIDVTTQFDSVLKGIYVFEGDKLKVCLAKDEDVDRPTKFEAPGGSRLTLMNLRLAPETQPAPVAPVAKPSPPPRDTAADEAREREAKIRRMITGSWVMNDSKGLLTAVFQTDGGFVATRTWSRSAKRLLGPSSDTSNGGWTYRDGRLTAWVTTTTDARILGHQFSGRVQTIGEDSMVLTDSYGMVRTFKKLR